MNTYCPNWEAIDDNPLPDYWHETKRRIERRRLFAQLAAALLACVMMFAAGYAVGERAVDDSEDFDCESYSSDGFVILRMGTREYALSPKMAEDVAIGLVMTVEDMQEDRPEVAIANESK